MTRIVLFLTAVPLAAILALVLNSLLERATERPRVLKSFVFFVFVAALTMLGAASPAAARTEAPEQRCGSIECSLTIDKQQLDDLWSRLQPKKVRLLYQSRIPVTEETLRDTNDSLLVDERGQQRPHEVSAEEIDEGSLETLPR
jgi:hypothetical protein